MFRTMISLVLQEVEMGKWEKKSIKITKFGKDRGSAIKSPERRKQIADIFMESLSLRVPDLGNLDLKSLAPFYW